MKFVKFILLLLKNGSLKSKPLDFEQRRKEVFKDAPINPKPDKKNILNSIRDRLARGHYTGSLVAALAYSKGINRLHKQYFIIDALQLSYVRVFKAGSTSMLRQLLPLIDPEIENKNLTDKQIDELSNQYVRAKCERYQEEYTRFALVRNPFQRMVSVYLDLFDPENPFFSYQAYLFGILKREMTFSQFVQVVNQIPDALKSNHFIQQFNIIRLCGGRERIKCFRLEKDMPALKVFLLNYNLNFDHANRHKTEYDYRQYYDQQTVQLVYEMYRIDVEEFDYKDEYNILVNYLHTVVDSPATLFKSAR